MHASGLLRLLKDWTRGYNSCKGSLEFITLEIYYWFEMLMLLLLKVFQIYWHLDNVGYIAMWISRVFLVFGLGLKKIRNIISENNPKFYWYFTYIGKQIKYIFQVLAEFKSSQI